MSRIATVSTELELRLLVPGGPDLPVRAGLHYAAADPWAVRVTFRTEGGGADGAIAWLFARQLLTDGVAAATGEGDVQVWPSTVDGRHVVNLRMASPSGSARFQLDRDELVVFLQQTYLSVPTGSEERVVDLDAELALLLPGQP